MWRLDGGLGGAMARRHAQPVTVACLRRTSILSVAAQRRLARAFPQGQIDFDDCYSDDEDEDEDEDEDGSDSE